MDSLAAHLLRLSGDGDDDGGDLPPVLPVFYLFYLLPVGKTHRRRALSHKLHLFLCVFKMCGRRLSHFIGLLKMAAPKEVKSYLIAFFCLSMVCLFKCLLNWPACVNA